MTGVMLPFWLLVGCGEITADPWLPITELVVENGTDKQQVAAQAGLVQMDADLGWTLKAQSVSFQELVVQASRSGGHVSLDNDLATTEVGTELQHELCHILDTGQSSALGISDDLAEAIVGNESSPSYYHGDEGSILREAFADLCEEGPALAEHLAMVCPEDDPVVSQVGTYLDQMVWKGPSAWELPPEIPEPLAWSSDQPVEGLSAFAGVGQIQLQLSLAGETVEYVWLDVYTGEVANPDPGDPWNGDPPDLGWAEGPDFGGIMGVNVVGWTSGPAAAWVEVEFGPHRVRRVYASEDGHTWSLADCGQAYELTSLVAVDQQIWKVWLEVSQLDGTSIVKWIPVGE